MITTIIFDFSYVLYLPQNEGKLNQDLIQFVTDNQTQFANYIFSASTPQTLDHFRPQLIPPFIDIFSSKELGLSKYKAQTYQSLATKLGLSPQQILFTDDKLDNVAAAQKADLQTIHFKNTAYFLKKAKKLLSI